jgi:hypothetical protein
LTSLASAPYHEAAAEQAALTASHRGMDDPKAERLLSGVQRRQNGCFPASNGDKWTSAHDGSQRTQSGRSPDRRLVPGKTVVIVPRLWHSANPSG